MKQMMWVVVAAMLVRVAAGAETLQDPIRAAVQKYFDQAFERLGAVAARNPSVDSLRQDMKPLVDATPGFFGGTLIDTNFVIIQVYYPRDFLARGFDLKKVDQLTAFWKKMREAPTPQLSEPGHGNIVQPRLIAMRYPVIVDGKLQSIVSMMVRTESFLEQTGLAGAKGYRISCRGVLAEEDGKLGDSPKSVTVSLPANEWLIEYVK